MKLSDLGNLSHYQVKNNYSASIKFSIQFEIVLHKTADRFQSVKAITQSGCQWTNKWFQYEWFLSYMSSLYKKLYNMSHYNGCRYWPNKLLYNNILFIVTMFCISNVSMFVSRCFVCFCNIMHFWQNTNCEHTNQFFTISLLSTYL